MKIVAAIKVVPDDEAIKVAGDRTLDASKAKEKISTYDLNAIEAGAQLAAAAFNPESPGDPGANYYFNCNQPRSIRTERPLLLNFDVGLRFNF